MNYFIQKYPYNERQGNLTAKRRKGGMKKKPKRIKKGGVSPDPLGEKDYLRPFQYKLNIYNIKKEAGGGSPIPGEYLTTRLDIPSEAGPYLEVGFKVPKDYNPYIEQEKRFTELKVTPLKGISYNYYNQAKFQTKKLAQKGYQKYKDRKESLKSFQAIVFIPRNTPKGQTIEQQVERPNGETVLVHFKPPHQFLLRRKDDYAYDRTEYPNAGLGYPIQLNLRVTPVSNAYRALKGTKKVGRGLKTGAYYGAYGLGVGALGTAKLAGRGLGAAGQAIGTAYQERNRSLEEFEAKVTIPRLARAGSVHEDKILNPNTKKRTKIRFKIPDTFPTAPRQPKLYDNNGGPIRRDLAGRAWEPQDADFEMRLVVTPVSVGYRTKKGLGYGTRKLGQGIVGTGRAIGVAGQAIGDKFAAARDARRAQRPARGRVELRRTRRASDEGEPDDARETRETRLQRFRTGAAGAAVAVGAAGAAGLALGARGARGAIDRAREALSSAYKSAKNKTRKLRRAKVEPIMNTQNVEPDVTLQTLSTEEQAGTSQQHSEMGTTRQVISKKGKIPRLPRMGRVELRRTRKAPTSGQVVELSDQPVLIGAPPRDDDDDASSSTSVSDDDERDDARETRLQRFRTGAAGLASGARGAIDRAGEALRSAYKSAKNKTRKASREDTDFPYQQLPGKVEVVVPEGEEASPSRLQTLGSGLLKRLSTGRKAIGDFYNRAKTRKARLEDERRAQDALKDPDLQPLQIQPSVDVASTPNIFDGMNIVEQPPTIPAYEDDAKTQDIYSDETPRPTPDDKNFFDDETRRKKNIRQKAKERLGRVVDRVKRRTRKASREDTDFPYQQLPGKVVISGDHKTRKARLEDERRAQDALKDPDLQPLQIQPSVDVASTPNKFEGMNMVEQFPGDDKQASPSRLQTLGSGFSERLRTGREGIRDAYKSAKNKTRRAQAKQEPMFIEDVDDEPSPTRSPKEKGKKKLIDFVPEIDDSDDEDETLSALYSYGDSSDYFHIASEPESSGEAGPSADSFSEEKRLTRLTKFLGDALEIHNITKFREINPRATFTDYRKVVDASDLDERGKLQLRFRYEDIRVRAWLETDGTLNKEEHRQLLINSRTPVIGIEKDTKERHIKRVELAKKSPIEQEQIINMMKEELEKASSNPSKPPPPSDRPPMVDRPSSFRAQQSTLGSNQNTLREDVPKKIRQTFTVNPSLSQSSPKSQRGGKKKRKNKTKKRKNKRKRRTNKKNLFFFFK